MNLGEEIEEGCGAFKMVGYCTRDLSAGPILTERTLATIRLRMAVSHLGRNHTLGSRVEVY